MGEAGQGRHKACPYRSGLGGRGRRWVAAGQGTHEGCPYGGGGEKGEAMGVGGTGHPQGVPLQALGGEPD